MSMGTMDVIVRALPIVVLAVVAILFGLAGWL